VHNLKPIRRCCKVHLIYIQSASNCIKNNP